MCARMFPCILFFFNFLLERSLPSNSHSHTHTHTQHTPRKNRDSPVRLAKSIRAMIRASATEMESVGRIRVVAILDTKVMHVIS